MEVAHIPLKQGDVSLHRRFRRQLPPSPLQHLLREIYAPYPESLGYPLLGKRNRDASGAHRQLQHRARLVALTGRGPERDIRSLGAGHQIIVSGILIVGADGIGHTVILASGRIGGNKRRRGVLGAGSRGWVMGMAVPSTGSGSASRRSPEAAGWSEQAKAREGSVAALSESYRFSFNYPKFLAANSQFTIFQKLLT